MKLFETPKLEVYEIEIEDVLTVSEGQVEDLDDKNLGQWG